MDAAKQGIMKCELTEWVREGIKFAEHYGLDHLDVTIIPEDDEEVTYCRLLVCSDGVRESWSVGSGY